MTSGCEYSHSWCYMLAFSWFNNLVVLLFFQALLKTEGVDLSFTKDAIKEIARVAEVVNLEVDNIGARRLYTVIERITEQVRFPT